jgi:hypothetical protein
VKKERYILSLKKKCSFIFFLILLFVLFTPFGNYRNRLEELVIKETWVVFGCTRLIPAKQNLSENAVRQGIFLLTFRFLYFIILSIGSAIMWADFSW